MDTLPSIITDRFAAMQAAQNIRLPRRLAWTHKQIVARKFRRCVTSVKSEIVAQLRILDAQYKLLTYPNVSPEQEQIVGWSQGDPTTLSSRVNDADVKTFVDNYLTKSDADNLEAFRGLVDATARIIAEEHKCSRARKSALLGAAEAV